MNLLKSDWFQSIRVLKLHISGMCVCFQGTLQLSLFQLPIKALFCTKKSNEKGSWWAFFHQCMYMKNCIWNLKAKTFNFVRKYSIDLQAFELHHLQLVYHWIFVLGVIIVMCSNEYRNNWIDILHHSVSYVCALRFEWFYVCLHFLHKWGISKSYLYVKLSVVRNKFCKV